MASALMHLRCLRYPFLSMWIQNLSILSVFSFFATFSVSVMCGTVAASEGEEWANRYVIATTRSDARVSPIVVGVVKNIHQYDEDFFDFIAEVLSESYRSDSSGSAQGLVKILVESENYRYASLVRAADKYVGLFKIGSAVRRYLKSSIGSNVQQFKAGGISLDDIRASYIQQSRDFGIEAVQGESLLLKLTRSTTIDDMFKLLGKPQHVVSGVTRKSSPLFKRNYMRLSFFYRKQGLAIFDYNRKRGWYFRKVIVDPILFEEHMPYRNLSGKTDSISRDGLFILNLLRRNPLSVKTVAVDLFKNGGASIEVLDAAAEMLLNRFNDSNDRSMIDAYSWVCKLLVKQGGRRYKEALRFIAKNSRNKKLAGSARFVMRSANDISLESYSKGAVSIEELIKRYPSPYPDVDLEL